MAATEEQALQELENSILFEPDFPKRISLTHEQFATLSQAERVGLRQPSVEARGRARHSWKHLADLVQRLGRARYEPAVPTLARLWRECALDLVRLDAGRALFAMRTEQARSALESMIEDADSVVMCVIAVFDRDPDRAYGYYENRFHHSSAGLWAVRHAALSLFVPCTYSIKDGKRMPEWRMEPRAPGWLKRDPRWLELCARLRHDADFGHLARDVLRHADPDDTKAALKRVRKAEPAQRVETRMKRSGDLLARYRSGEFEAVWQEIRSHQRIGGAFREEVLAVAEETMRRVAQNADRISERLRAKGWKALSADLVDLRTSPSPGDEAVFRRIVEITASPIPPTLLAFWRVVGGINWVWDYEAPDPMPNLGVDLPMDEMDPLCVHPPSAFTQHRFDEWIEQKEQPDPDLVESFSIDLAPDYLHKANISGGGPYAVLVPFFGADPVFAYERHNLPFLDYLRLAFQWAGFPGLEEHAERADVKRFVTDFGRGPVRF